MSAIVKRSVSIAGHQTSVSLEAAFWEALAVIAAREQKSIAGLIAEIDQTRTSVNLSSALRLHVLNQARLGNLPLD